jgi:hypothetical protein
LLQHLWNFEEDICAFKVSWRFDDVFDPAGQKVIHLCIVTAQAFVSSHSQDVIKNFPQMALLRKG